VLRLTPLLQEQICALIRAGAYPHVAALASGVPREVWDRWLASASKKDPQKKYRLLKQAIDQAQAVARCTAEIAVLKDSPDRWLRTGPGKEAEGNPGWSIPVKPHVTNNQQINVLLSPQMQGLFAAILQVLSPYPEARAAVALALSGKPETPGLPCQSPA
jgi:hypothetical protein